MPTETITFPAATNPSMTGGDTDMPVVLNSDLFDQGGSSSGCGNAPDTSLNDIVHSEFTTGEPGLIFLDAEQPSVAHLADGSEVEVEAPAPMRSSRR